MTREFCPSTCKGLQDNRICTAPTFLSDTDRSKDRCWMLDDEVIDPRKIRIKWTRQQSREATIVGVNWKADQYILDDGTRVGIGSPLILK